ncbi:MAG: RNA polymerase sigma factor [Spirosomataceae bacterium]|nr:sigma-70 family RNA polymerase sigma factor [Flectobacillus sp.]
MLFFGKKHSTPSSQDLLTKYRQTGDLAILGKLYEPQMELVFGICFKYFKDEEEAKDATMQIFEELIEKLRKHEVENFPSWLATLSRNYCLMQLRKKNLFVPSTDYNDNPPDNEEENVIPFMELIDNQHLTDEWDLEGNLTRLDKCLEALGKEQQQTISLFFLKEKTYQEIVTETGYELSKVKSYLQNGKRNLKNCIERG